MKFTTLLLGLTTFGQALASDYNAELNKWHLKQDERLRTDTGWLTVVGLSWLKEGANTVGSAADQDIQLPASAPKQMAVIHHKKDGSRIEFVNSGGIKLNGNSVSPKKYYPLKTGEKEGLVKVGSVSFFLIERKNGIGVRTRDTNAETRKNFKGLKWFNADTKYVVNADWHKLERSRKLFIPDILGNVNEEEINGFVTFSLNGKNYELYPTEEPDGLFFVFRDETSGNDTYGGGRFLYSDLPKEGKVTLDFNRAVNPPCAVTKFATCPLPPKENILALRIPAGELAPEGHH